MQTFIYIGDSPEAVLAGVKSQSFAIEVSSLRKRGSMTGRVVARRNKAAWPLCHESDAWERTSFLKVERREIKHLFKNVSPYFRE